MGDQIGTATGGRLSFVPMSEIERVRALPVTREEATSLFASICRINALYMIACAGSGHIGSSFSSMEIFCWMLLNELRAAPADSNEPADVFFSSKGHDAPALYSAAIGMGRLDFELLHRLRRLGGLPGHPDVSVPCAVTNTGSLGMGVSKAKGMIVANRLLNKPGNVFVLTGDGELQEGQFWESLISAANHHLHELIVIIDHNKLQSDNHVSLVSDLGNLEGKLAAFGWHVQRCDGNDVHQLAVAVEVAKAVKSMPKVIIADTVKGKGVSFMEHTAMDSDTDCYKFHSGAPSEALYLDAVNELVDGLNARLDQIGVTRIELGTVSRPPANAPGAAQRLIDAYTQALLSHAETNPRIVALDADLIRDTGLIPFKENFPERFVECGIAEQDMVSQAGGMALRGLLPVVHSFSCFLSARPREQIYNNATERTKIIYVGSLAGLLPAGPGHSHQAVCDISALSAIPGLVLIAPGTERDVRDMMSWAVEASPSSCYIRLESIPVELADSASVGTVAPGCGAIIAAGDDVAIVAYGPTMLKEALAARELLLPRGLTARVINMPWLNRVDTVWLDTAVRGNRLIVVIDNHYSAGGLGEHIVAAMAAKGICNVKTLCLGLDDIPACGAPAEILAHHGLTGAAIAEKIITATAGKQ